jgi:hypothetical protein
MINSPTALKKIGTFMFALGIPLLGFWFRWDIYDEWRLRGYQPEPMIVQLADEIDLNDSSRRVFYSNMPSLLEKANFLDNCTTGERTIVLGCYVPFDGIYLQNITDDRLEGILQVTSAHEVLHAHYQRLLWYEKDRVDALLFKQFESMSDERIINTIASYRENGADINNELHSIIGTEVRVISPELELYYSRYFNDRAKVVKYSEDYESAFTEIKDKAVKYDKQLESLKAEIENDSNRLEVLQLEITAGQNELNRLLEQDRVSEYNAKVTGFNSIVNSYNAKVNSVRDLIERYNNLIKLRNELATEQNELFDAIDSRPNTIKTQ